MKPRIVYVRWHDAIHPTGEWQFSADFERDPNMLTETVGWMVHRTRRTVQVAVTVSGRGTHEEQFTGIMTVPMGCVESITTIPHDGSEGKAIYTRRQPKPKAPKQ